MLAGKNIRRSMMLLLVIWVVTLACRQTVDPLGLPTNTSSTPEPLPPGVSPTSVSYLPIVRQAGDPTIETPTPDPPQELPALRLEAEQYVVQVGDTLGDISRRFGVSAEMIIAANGLVNPDLLAVGQVLIIPAPIPIEQGTGYKIIPDSELVYGPLADFFDILSFLTSRDSYLLRYSEDVDGEMLDGSQIVERVAREFSVNPRLLLAVLEYQSGWVTQANPSAETRDYPMGVHETWREGLYLQLAWAANNLNRGYYLWRVNGVGGWNLQNGIVVPVDPTINAGTAGVQQMFAMLSDQPAWEAAVSPQGLSATFNGLFGYAFDYSRDPVVQEGSEQPAMQLPFEDGVNWAFTGGPHGGWGDGSAWSALDFAPGNGALGCVQSEYWGVAVADGLVIRAEHGVVVQDLDGDGREGTGWTVLYLHIESRDRVANGTYLHAGERIGHPSCEGGVSTGTHLHLSRRYNGEWIPADQNLPFNLDGWISSGNGIEYDGYLQRDGQTLEAWEGFFPENTIQR